MSPQSTVDSALHLASLGFAVFPCNGKLPATSHGFKNSSKEPETIKLWSWEGKNIGLATGAVSGVWVLDIDVKNDAGGPESLRALEANHGPLPETVQAITQSKGIHYYFKYDKRLGCRTGVKPGIDTRSDGGYVIVPPSQGYEWECMHALGALPIVQAPEWLVELCSRQIPQTARTDSDEIITKNRNSTLTSIAGKLRRVGMAQDELLVMLQSINSKRCQPPLPDDEVRSIAGSVGRYKSIVAVQVNTPDPEDAGKVGAVSTSWEKMKLPLNKNNQPICNVDCALRVMEGLNGSLSPVWYDEFHRRYFTQSMHNPGVIREWQDIDDLYLTAFMQRELGLSRISDDMVSKAVRLYSQKHTKNEPRDWFDSLEWDGNIRLPRFFSDAMGSSYTAYTQQASCNFWIGIVARIYRPGCKMDNMIVLEGPQGCGKTRALHAIGGEWHTECEEAITSKDFFQTLHGKLIIEIAELDSFSKAEVTRIKQVISCQTDRYRESYARNASDHPRMSVFVGTTNEDGYLKDSTGGRRFWPIRCGKVDIDYIFKNRTQLFAEAVLRFKQGDDWYRMPDDETRAEQEDRRQYDEWEGVISEFLTSRGEITVMDIALECLKFDPSRVDRVSQTRIGKCLRSINWQKIVKRDNGTLKKIWVKRELPF